jgi:hypothetical protein
VVHAKAVPTSVKLEQRRSAPRTAGRIHLLSLTPYQGVTRKTNAIDLVNETYQSRNRRLSAELRKAMRVVGGPVERTDDPSMLAPPRFDCLRASRMARVCDGVRRTQARTIHRGARPRSGLNGRPINVSATSSLDRGLLGCRFSLRSTRAAQFLFDLLGGLHVRSQGVRHMGSALLTSVTSRAAGLTRCGNSRCGRWMSRQGR